MNREKILDFMESDDYRPMKIDQLISAMNVDDNDLETFFALLRELELDGHIVVNRKQMYGLSCRMGLILGTLQGNVKGFGFLIPDDKSMNDIFIPVDYLNSALNGDKVLVRVNKSTDSDSKIAGEVVRILKHANEEVVGILEESRGYGFVIPDEKRLSRDIFIPGDGLNKAKTGDRVVVKITKWPKLQRSAEGEIIEIIGNENDPGVDILSIIRKFHLKEDFPPSVIDEANKVAHISPYDYGYRTDLRDELMITIDGADAKDLDDAVSLSILDNGNYKLGVHIADVGHYVPIGSKLDLEAYQRATSVYLPDRVIPMLPKQLSNDICSLNPQLDRLSLSCIMEINRTGKVVNSQIVESVINTDERMTYDDVNLMINNGDDELIKKYKHIYQMLVQMNELRVILDAKRQKRGSLYFDFPEAKVVLADDGTPIDIVKRTQDTAEKIIEEFMIVANETVAAEYFYRDIPFIYRIHEVPKDESVQDLKEFLQTLGYNLVDRSLHIRPHTYQKLLSKVAGTPEEKLINMVVLRSLSHARYDTDNYGHFGLASDFYSHFTSPIRRYPDLCIHRVIKMLIHDSTMDDAKHDKLLKRLGEAANQSSEQERNAEQAERDATDLKKTQYMANHIGDVYDGIISGVASYGFFVELDNTVNGLVHVSTISGDYYEYYDKKKMLVGNRSKKSYKLGDLVKIKVVRVDVTAGLVDFEINEDLDNDD